MTDKAICDLVASIKFVAQELHTDPLTIALMVKALGIENTMVVNSIPLIATTLEARKEEV